MKQHDIGTIYGIYDPTTGALRYVGKTASELRARLSGHLQEARSGRGHPLAVWLREVVAADLRPDIRPLEEHVPAHELKAAEDRHISQARAGGAELLNCKDNQGKFYDRQSAGTSPGVFVRLSDSERAKLEKAVAVRQALAPEATWSLARIMVLNALKWADGVLSDAATS